MSLVSQPFLRWSSSSSRDFLVRRGWLPLAFGVRFFGATSSGGGSAGEDWKAAGLGARWAEPTTTMSDIVFVQTGFGCDQHGTSGANKAVARACRDAIMFNALPYMENIMRDNGLAGREDMLINVRVGVPSDLVNSVDVEAVRSSFPYGQMLPVEVVSGGLDFASGRVVTALGDTHDRAVVACVAVTVGIPAK
ncbi:hypothetical protein PPROV_000724700 [Pycnococcus provasolii]|uniref:Uncharacterized protein n=2 Tax=Pycnococcus provasolii TaxID=41880 RepID=A0A830HU92_9CHLO|nr:hypothetical protein PPROV_000724700 [Pycnococcus provasolii]